MLVVVNADDLGLAPAIDVAIRDALREGLVSSASMIATGPTVAEAARWVREFPGASFGAHLDLSEGAPLTRVPFPELLEGGRFSARSRRLGWRHLDGVVAELSAQVRRLGDLGVPVDHLDSHQHLHRVPVVREAVIRVARRFGVRRVRTWGGLRPLGTPWPRVWAERARAAAFRARLRAAGLVTTEGFASLARWREHRPAWRTVEWMVHPGNPHDPVYAEEMAWLGRERPVIVPWRAIAG